MQQMPQAIPSNGVLRTVMNNYLTHGEESKACAAHGRIAGCDVSRITDMPRLFTEEHRIRVEWPDGVVQLYDDGAKGQERLIRAERPDGGVLFYDGAKDQERLIRAQMPDGRVQFYDDAKGQERLIRAQMPDGRVQFYDDAKDQERLIRVEWPDVGVLFYDGAKDQERLIRVEWPDGRVQFYDGAKGQERRIRAERPDGGVLFYDGAKGQERVIRAERPDGGVLFYDGAKGQERLIRAQMPDGRVQFYDGAKVQERLIRVEWPDGRVLFYGGAKDQERAIRAERPDGQVVFDDAKGRKHRATADRNSGTKNQPLGSKEKKTRHGRGEKAPLRMDGTFVNTPSNQALGQSVKKNTQRPAASLTLTPAVARWQVAFRHIRQAVKKEKYHLMQTAINRVEARKRALVRAACERVKEAATANAAATRLAREKAAVVAPRSMTGTWYEETPGASARAKALGEKAERLEKHKVAIAERKKADADAKAEQDAITERMAKCLAIGDAIVCGDEW